MPAFFVCLGLAAGSSALTLGDLQVRSTLGQPFSGVVQVDAAAGEVIRRECFSLGSNAGAMPGVPLVENVRFVIESRGGSSLLRILGKKAVREPLAQVILQVRCPGLPRLTRTFVLLLDPASIAQAPAEITPLFPNQANAIARGSESGKRVSGDIRPGSLYTVRAGDTLSGIAARIDGRPSYTVWPLAARIKETNPAAFENGRSDRLVAGSSLAIPKLDGIVASNNFTSSRQAPTPDSLVAARVTGQASAANNTVVMPDGAASNRSTKTLFDTPVLLGESVNNVDLEYLILTPMLSRVSLDRIKQRSGVPAQSQPETSAPAQQDEPPVVAAAQTELRPEISEPGWIGGYLYWILGGLLLLAAAVLAFMYTRRTENSPAQADTESPWELDGEGDMPGLPAANQYEKTAGLVYDDFEGTFVSVEPVVITSEKPGDQSEAEDPESEVMTHLMPTVDESSETVKTIHNEARSDFDDVRNEFSRQRDRSDVASEINVTTLEETADNITEAGWVELDFEATQILEQDYLAEYAATLKDKIKEQNAEQDNEPEDEENFDEEDIDEEPLMLAHEMLSSPDTDTAELRALTAEAKDSEDEKPIVLAAPDDDDMTATLSLAPSNNATEDNVVAIAKGKKKDKQSKEDDEPQHKGHKKS